MTIGICPGVSTFKDLDMFHEEVCTFYADSLYLKNIPDEWYVIIHCDLCGILELGSASSRPTGGCPRGLHNAHNQNDKMLSYRRETALQRAL